MLLEPAACDRKPRGTRWVRIRTDDYDEDQNDEPQEHQENRKPGKQQYDHLSSNWPQNRVLTSTRRSLRDVALADPGKCQRWTPLYRPARLIR